MDARGITPDMLIPNLRSTMDGLGDHTLTADKVTGLPRALDRGRVRR